METASHLSFIKPFTAVTAEGAVFYELLNNPAELKLHLTASNFLKPGGDAEQMTSSFM